MKLQDGPLFGALIVGVGVGYLIGLKSGNALYGIVGGAAIALADYTVLTWISKFKKK